MPATRFHGHAITEEGCEAEEGQGQGEGQGKGSGKGQGQPSDPQQAPGEPEPQSAASITKAEIDENAFEEKLAALFDPVPVEFLEKMFPSDGKWKQWADKAKATGLICARKARAKFNPYQAGVWFIRKGMEGWDEARLYRTLANNLPARSRASKHLLTGDVD